ncbi:MAG: aminoacyl-tRNA hydrolase [Candidatus Woesebacteria bacterium]|nr:MAG: aminoacyl-tRNA hydrolase [Candidatus Woesebacteria bacterium]
MKLIIGLGNPGAEYINTRHNVGFMVADELQKVAGSKKLVASGKQFKIAKSDKFMNESGIFVKKLSSNYNLPTTDLYIVHDDLDIKLGEYKIQLGHGPKDHNGIRSIDEALGTDQYWHVKVGVDNRPLDNKPLGIEYVLQNFTNEERIILDKVIKEVCHQLKNL